MNTIDLEVQGISCGSCVKHVTQALQTLSGVRQVDVNLPSGHVKVRGTLSANAQAVIEALDAAGYPAKLTTSVSPPVVTSSGGGSSNSRPKCGGCCG